MCKGKLGFGSSEGLSGYGLLEALTKGLRFWDSVLGFRAQDLGFAGFGFRAIYGYATLTIIHILKDGVCQAGLSLGHRV